MKRFKGLNNYGVSILDKHYKATQWDFLFFCVAFLHEGIQYSYARFKLDNGLEKPWGIIIGVGLIILSLWILYRWIKRRNTNLEFNNKNIIYKTINLKFEEKEEAVSYNDIEKIQVKKPGLRGLIMLAFVLICMISGCHSLKILQETYFDWILFVIISALIFFWRSFYCYIVIKFKSSSDFSSCTIRAKDKKVINELSELKVLKDVNIF